MRKLIISLLLFIKLFADDKNEADYKILKCLYKEINIEKVIENKGLNTKEHIENLLYAPEHKDKYFLKAVVLDYFYDSSKAKDYYDIAYKTTDIKEKGFVGLYYAVYLQRKGLHTEATKVLRSIDSYHGKGLDIPRKIAYQYYIYGLKQDIQITNYLKLKGILDLEIEGEIDGCRKKSI